MSAAVRPAPWSLEYFLEWEAQQDERHEFIDGRVYAMVGARAGHKRQVVRMLRRVADQLTGTLCDVFDETFKLVADGNAFYPDLLVTCAPPDDADAYVEDAELIVEFVSPGTASRDRGRKVDAYLTLPSLRAYVIVSEDGERAEVYAREDDGPWMERETALIDVAVLVHRRTVRLA